MFSISREKYSKYLFLALFYAFLSLGLVLSAHAQEIGWSQPGAGRHPVLSVLLEGNLPKLLVIGSPFSGGILALDPLNGQPLWKARLTDRLAWPARLSADTAYLSTHTADLIALSTDDGRTLWRQSSTLAIDEAAASPTILENSIYLLTAQGELTRTSLTGERLNATHIDAKSGRTVLEFVPLWRDTPGLIFLDQGGRLQSYDPLTLKPISKEQITTAIGPGLGPQDSTILGGVLSSAQHGLWTTELSGLLRLSSLEQKTTVWTTPIDKAEAMYSPNGKVVAVPMLSPSSFHQVLVVSQRWATIVSAQTGQILERYPLPSPAAHPPLFDLDHKAWWLLTEDHLLELPWSGGVFVQQLPVPEPAYTAVLAGNLLIVGTESGRIYSLPLPVSPPKAESNPALSSKP